MKEALLQEAAQKFAKAYGIAPVAGAYAPGRVEVLGNHTDYNEGFVLSAAIDVGTVFLAAPIGGDTCRLVAGDLMAEETFKLAAPEALPRRSWANYVIGVFAGLAQVGRPAQAFAGLFLGNVPVGSGLSSSAALEMSAGLALARLYAMDVGPLALAKIGQAAEHHYAGVKCGLLDQITSLFGQAGHLVFTDFRSLAVEAVPLGHDACFLACNTAVKHSLVDGEYNERRARCEEAARFFAGALPHPVRALRDVSQAEWDAHAASMEPMARRRSAHVVGENDRVLRGRDRLRTGDLEGFGRFMFESHESSIHNFENSCPELDFLVKAAGRVAGVLGARLSGGGFGGSVIALVHPRDAETAASALRHAYARQFGHPCECRVIVPSDGARCIDMAAASR